MEAMTGILQRIASLETRGKIDERRKQFFVEKKFQKQFVLVFTAMVFILIFSSGVAFYIFFNNIIEQNLYTIHPRIQTVREVITPNLVLFFIEVTLLALIIIFLTVDRILNRTSKSLMQYERIADHLANLDFRKARTVETDGFRNLDRKYRALMEQYCADINGLKENIGKMQRLLETMEHANGTTDQEKKLTAMTELIELRGIIAAKLAEFKTEGTP